MNKKGLVIFYLLMLGTLIVVLALALAKPAKQIVDSAMSDLQCSSSEISDYDKAACYSWQAILFLFVGGVIFIGIGILFLRGVTPT